MGGQVYVSFSGGKDSTVLLHLVRRIYPDVEAVFCDTGLEFPELRDFVKTVENVTWIIPEKYDKKSKQWKRYTFLEILKNYGYPIISKQQSQYIYDFKNTHSEKTKKVRLKGNKYGMGKISKCYYFLLNADFKISDKCCSYMKKKPFIRFENITNKKCFLGNMTQESMVRETEWKKHGCNAFDKKRPISSPISFWTEQDVLQYIKKYNLEYASVYGDLVEDKEGKLHFTGCQRTGCVFCGFGCHLEKEPNRFQRLAEMHPKLYNYCINGGEYSEDGVWQPSKEGLGMGHVLDYIGVNYKPVKE